MKEHLFQPAQPKRATEKFLELCGTWQDDRAPAAIAGEIRKSRNTVAPISPVANHGIL